MDKTYPNLRLGVQSDRVLNGRWPVRVYLSDEGKTHYRCHIALPEELFLLEPYQYPKRFQKWWKRDDGYYLFDSMITRPNHQVLSPDDLTVSLRALLLKIMRVVVKQTTII